MTEKRGMGRLLRRRSSRFAGIRNRLLGMGIFVLIGGQAGAFTAYVSNEKSNTISVIDTDKFAVVKTIKVGQRPRGIGLTKDEKFILVAVGDDDTIQVIDTRTYEVVATLPSGPDPELFTQDHTGKILYVANENDNTVTIIELERRVPLGDVQVGVEPEGMGLSPDGKTLVATSETSNMAHFIDTETRRIVANVLVDARPRFAEFKRDASEVWVSSEIGGTVSVIDPVKHEVNKKITFDIPGLQDRIRSARSCQSRCRGQCCDARGPEISSRGPARLAHGVYPGRKISSHDQRRIERRLHHRRRKSQSHQDDPGRRASLGYRDLTAVTASAFASRWSEKPLDSRFRLGADEATGSGES